MNKKDSARLLLFSVVTLGCLGPQQLFTCFEFLFLFVSESDFLFLSTDAELSSHDETNTAEIIDQMFEEVLEYAERLEEERLEDEDTEDRDSGVCTWSGDKDKTDTESEKEKSEEEGDAKEEESDESKKLESNGDELLTFPPSGILSPLSKSVEAVVTPLVRLI